MKPRSPEWYRDWEESLDGQPSEVPAHELRHLLRCARAWAELEAHMRRPETLDHVDLYRVGDQMVAYVDGEDAEGPDLLAATEAALAKAKETTR